jgi:hypothetical protein
VFRPLVTFLPQVKSNRCFTLSKHRTTKITKLKDLVKPLQTQNNLAQINLFFGLDLAALKTRKHLRGYVANIAFFIGTREYHIAQFEVFIVFTLYTKR